MLEWEDGIRKARDHTTNGWQMLLWMTETWRQEASTPHYLPCPGVGVGKVACLSHVYLLVVSLREDIWFLSVCLVFPVPHSESWFSVKKKKKRNPVERPCLWMKVEGNEWSGRRKENSSVDTPAQGLAHGVHPAIITGHQLMGQAFFFMKMWEMMTIFSRPKSGTLSKSMEDISWAYLVSSPVLNMIITYKDLSSKLLTLTQPISLAPEEHLVNEWTWGTCSSGTYRGRLLFSLFHKGKEKRKKKGEERVPQFNLKGSGAELGQVELCLESWWWTHSHGGWRGLGARQLAFPCPHSLSGSQPFLASLWSPSLWLSYKHPYQTIKYLIWIKEERVWKWWFTCTSN